MQPARAENRRLQLGAWSAGLAHLAQLMGKGGRADAVELGTLGTARGGWVISLVRGAQETDSFLTHIFRREPPLIGRVW